MVKHGKTMTELEPVEGRQRETKGNKPGNHDSPELFFRFSQFFPVFPGFSSLHSAISKKGPLLGGFVNLLPAASERPGVRG